MAKYVPDVKTRRWVVLAPERTRRPDEIGTTQQKPDGTCVFCPGNESYTPPEVLRIGSGMPDGAGWNVRVVPNKFPITDIHEVVIHSPDCKRDIEELPEAQAVRILTAYRSRYRAHRENGQVLIFCNHGKEGGASLRHPHSQIVVIPHQIILDAVEREPVTNMVEETAHFVTYCPDFSQWPFEVWIAPKDEGTLFGDITDGEMAELAPQLQRALRAIGRVSTETHIKSLHWGEAYSYNYYISHEANWFVRIIPRAVSRAGFELGTGLSVNVVGPQTASEVLRHHLG